MAVRPFAVGAVILLSVGLLAGPPGSLHAQPEPVAPDCLTWRQDGRRGSMPPLVGERPVEAVYDHGDFRSHSRFVQENSSVLFLYAQRGADCGELALVAIHQSDQPAQAEFVVTGLPPNASVELADDPNDALWVGPPSARLRWQWTAEHTDGIVLDGLGGEQRLTIDPSFDEAIEDWVLLGGDLADPRRVELPSREEPLQIATRSPDPVARFRMTPAVPRVNQPVTFDATASSSSAGAIVRYRWDFDEDGEVEQVTEAPEVTHRFRSASRHEVTLIVEDGAGRTAEITRTFEVREGVVRVTRALRTPLPDRMILPGAAITVELRVRAHETVRGLGLAESTPEDWPIEPIPSDGVRFNPKRGAWLIMGTLEPGETRTVRYRIRVPADADLGDYAFAGRAVSSSPELEREIRGTHEVTVVRTLPVELAVSRLSEEGGIELTRSNLISLPQILKAIELWKTGEPVPQTGGKRVDLSMMTRLVAYWVSDRPVTEPLP